MTSETTPATTPELIDTDIRIKFDDLYNPKTMIRKVAQDIPSSFLDRLKDDRLASSNAPMGNFHKVASIPTAVVEKWRAEGFDIFDKNVSIKEILKRLQSQDLQAFIATTRRV